MARRSDGGTGSILRVHRQQRATVDIPWTVETYPWPDMSKAPDPTRERVETTERLFWRRDGTLAYRAGQLHPVDEEGLLMTWAEIGTKRGTTEPAKKKRGQRRSPRGDAA